MDLVKQSANLLKQFEEAARCAGATVERVQRDPVMVAAVVERVAPSTARIAVADSRDLPAELLDGCRRLPRVFVARSKSELAAADVGVTEAFAGVSASGSLCVAADEGSTGYISLLARTHIAIIAADSLVERVSNLFQRGEWPRSLALTRNFVFVTGPSATADMGPLVRGVHGPRRLHILVLE
jgi:L-lactate dehydrogenase complex protein LldG